MFREMQEMCTVCDLHSSVYDCVNENFEAGTPTTKGEIQELLDAARDRGVWPGCESLQAKHPNYFDKYG
jgi:hypothetical protein